jgi:hypothetical protein
MNRFGKTSARGVVALVILATLALVSPVHATHKSPAAAAAANKALVWLKTQQSPNGSLANNFSLTAELVLAIKAAGQNPNTFSAPSPVAYLQANAAAVVADGVGVIGKVALAAKAAGANPSSFGGKNLIRAIQSKENLGLYDTQLFNQAFAMMALRAAGKPAGDLAFIQVLLGQGLAGGWAFTNVLLDVPDTNSTAVAMQALLAAGGALRGTPLPTVSLLRAVRYLHGQQNTDAAFPYQQTSEFCTGPCPSDPNSTAYVIQALVAAGQNIDGPSWRMGGVKPVNALIAMQAPDGSFPGFSPVFATVQAVPGLLGKPFVCIAAPSTC